MYREQYGEYAYWCSGVNGLNTVSTVKGKLVHLPPSSPHPHHCFLHFLAQLENNLKLSYKYAGFKWDIFMAFECG